MVWTILLVNLFSITCVLAAAALAWVQREGWGWFLFVAVITYSGAAALGPKIETVMTRVIATQFLV